MIEKNKKGLYITLFVVDILLTVFLFVLSIVMLATMPSDQTELANSTGMIGWFQKNPTYILILVVIPLFILLALNVAVLVRYVKHYGQPKKVELHDLSDKEKEALKQELLKDLSKDKKE
jgi:uncharacterized membrane protein